MKSKTNIISTIVTLIIVIVLVFFLIKLLIPNQKDNVNENNLNLSVQEINKLGKEKFNFLNSKHTVLTNNLIFFSNNNIDINSIKNDDILYIAYSMLSLEDKNITGTSDSDCFLELGYYTKDNYPDKCSKERFDKNLLEEQINLNFSNNIKVNYQDFKSSGNQICLINSNEYNCYLQRFDLKLADYLTITNYDYAVLKDDLLEVYSSLLTIRRKDNDVLSEGVYKDSLATIKIDDLSYYNSTTNDIINNETTNLLINKYKEQATKYKSIFKKQNSNYVWVSTELI
ncbi:MAG: hypothetical protein IJ572_05735 [Bacilli bacterium]|nr:hypothetical protein [Bacilli bacterium]